MDILHDGHGRKKPYVDVKNRSNFQMYVNIRAGMRKLQETSKRIPLATWITIGLQGVDQVVLIIIVVVV